MFSNVFVRIVELDQKNDRNRLQASIPLLVLGLAGHGRAELGEELRHNDGDAFVDAVLVNLFIKIVKLVNFNLSES